MGKINVLSFEVANLIAAGEVVDRPSSVIKELVENSIDSGATRVTVEIQRGGIMFMRVTDNGCGIAPEDLPVAVRRHATSKIKDANDLDGIITLGFRGEALAAISAVSDVRIISKTAENPLGASIEVNSGRVGEVTERGASDGTTVIVENLFANVPARLKFLKRDLTEAMAVCSVVEKIAMSHPEIAIRMISDGVVKLDTAGDGKLYGVIRCVYGKDFAAKMMPVDSEQNGVRVYGYVTSPVAPRANRSYQNFFINGRYIKTRTGSAAIEQAYTSYIPPEKFPGCVLRIELSPNVVDVNVHPSKLEVKFSDERPVFDCIYHGVRGALRENSERPGFGTDSDKKNAEEKNVTQSFKTSMSTVVPRVSSAFVPINDRTAAADKTKDDFVRQLDLADNAAAFRGQNSQKNPVQSVQTQKEDFWQHISVVSDADADKDKCQKNKQDIPKRTEEVPPLPTENDAPPAWLSSLPHGNGTECVLTGNNEKSNNNNGTANYCDSGLPSDEGAKDDELVRYISDSGGIYRIVGEIFNSYILVEVGNELIVIDKHAAHERLIFEELRGRMAKGSERTSQFLAVPIEVMLMSDEVAAIEQYRERIENIGFSFSTARNTVYVNEIPSSIGTDDVETMFENFADVIKTGGGSVELTEEIVFEKALYQASCKAAIKAGRVYPEEFDEDIVKQLFDHPEVTYCPHGRPIALKIEKSYINHRFKRN